MTIIVKTFKINKDGGAPSLDEFEAICAAASGANRTDASRDWYIARESSGEAFRRGWINGDTLQIDRTYADETIAAAYDSEFSSDVAVWLGAMTAAGWTIVEE